MKRIFMECSTLSIAAPYWSVGYKSFVRFCVDLCIPCDKNLYNLYFYLLTPGFCILATPVHFRTLRIPSHRPFSNILRFLRFFAALPNCTVSFHYFSTPPRYFPASPRAVTHASHHITVSLRVVTGSSRYISGASRDRTFASRHIPVISRNWTCASRYIPPSFLHVTFASRQVPVSLRDVTMSSRRIPGSFLHVTCASRYIPQSSRWVSWTSLWMPGALRDNQKTSRTGIISFLQIPLTFRRITNSSQHVINSLHSSTKTSQCNPATIKHFSHSTIHTSHHSNIPSFLSNINLISAQSSLILSPINNPLPNIIK